MSVDACSPSPCKEDYPPHMEEAFRRRHLLFEIIPALTNAPCARTNIRPRTSFHLLCGSSRSTSCFASLPHSVAWGFCPSPQIPTRHVGRALLPRNSPRYSVEEDSIFYRPRHMDCSSSIFSRHSSSLRERLAIRRSLVDAMVHPEDPPMQRAATLCQLDRLKKEQSRLLAFLKASPRFLPAKHHWSPIGCDDAFGSSSNQQQIDLPKGEA